MAATGDVHRYAAELVKPLVRSTEIATQLGRVAHEYLAASAALRATWVRFASSHKHRDGASPVLGDIPDIVRERLRDTVHQVLAAVTLHISTDRKGMVFPFAQGQSMAQAQSLVQRFKAMAAALKALRRASSGAGQGDAPPNVGEHWDVLSGSLLQISAVAASALRRHARPEVVARRDRLPRQDCLAECVLVGFSLRASLMLAIQVLFLVEHLRGDSPPTTAPPRSHTAPSHAPDSVLTALVPCLGNPDRTAQLRRFLVAFITISARGGFGGPRWEFHEDPVFRKLSHQVELRQLAWAPRTWRKAKRKLKSAILSSQIPQIILQQVLLSYLPGTTGIAARVGISMMLQMTVNGAFGAVLAPVDGL